MDVSIVPNSARRAVQFGKVVCDICHVFDNAMCKSFFATLECELLDRRKFATKAEARSDTDVSCDL